MTQPNTTPIRDIDTQIESLLTGVLGVCQYDAGCNCDRSMLIKPTVKAIKTLLIQSNDNARIEGYKKGYIDGGLNFITNSKELGANK